MSRGKSLECLAIMPQGICLNHLVPNKPRKSRNDFGAIEGTSPLGMPANDGVAVQHSEDALEVFDIVCKGVQNVQVQLPFAHTQSTSRAWYMGRK